MLRVSSEHFFLVIFLSFFFWPQSAYAADPPNLISPPDNSTAGKSPKLIWEYSGGCVQSGSCFRVEVDNSPDFSSPEKSTYTNNFSYSPQGLSEGAWYWRVKAKDKSEKWSDWSKVFKFAISAQSATATPSPLGSPNPAAPEKATPTPQTPLKTQSAFIIGDILSEINSNQESEPLISLKLPNNPNEVFFLKGAFKKEGSSNYFGQTYSDGWVGNSEKYSKQLKISTDASGIWEGKIKVKPDTGDSGFDGTGNYVFKVARYSDSGSGPTWSNEATIKINEVATAKPSTEEKVKGEVTEEEKEADKAIDFTASLVKEPAKNYDIKIASVAGEATISNNINLENQAQVLEDKKINWLLIVLGLGILAGGAGFTYFKIKREINAKNYN